MADIAFLLLIFFMVTSVLKVDADLPLILPDAGGQEIKEKDLQISVDRNKQFYFGNIAMDLDATVARVQEQIPDAGGQDSAESRCKSGNQCS